MQLVVAQIAAESAELAVDPRYAIALNPLTNDFVGHVARRRAAAKGNKEETGSAETLAEAAEFETPADRFDVVVAG